MSESREIVSIHINPLHRDKLPRTATETMNRVNEISFSSSLLRKMRAVSFVMRLIDQGSVNGDRRRQMLIHGTRADDEMAQLGVASKLNADWDFLRRLRDIGRAHATAGWRGISTGCAKNRLSTSPMIFCDPAGGDATL